MVTINRDYPTKAADIPGSKYEGKDDIYYAANVNKAKGNATAVEGNTTAVVGYVTVTNVGYKINIDGDTPVIIQKPELRDKVVDATGITPPTRDEFSGRAISEETRMSYPDADWERLYTIATGCILLFSSPSEETRIALGQNDASKKQNPLRHNISGSGLVSSKDPIVTAFLETNEENAMFAVENGKLIGLNFDFPEKMYVPQWIKDDTFGALRERQAEKIQKEIVELYPEHAGKEIEWRIVPMTLVKTDATSPVMLQMHDNIYDITSAHVVMDNDKMSLNMHYPMAPDLAAAGITAKPSELLFVNPEKFGGPKMLVTFAEAYEMDQHKTQDLIPAPSDFVRRTGGYPLKLAA